MIWDALQADTHRQYGKFSWGLVMKGALTRRNFRVVLTMRLCQAAANSSYRKILLAPCKILHKIATHFATVDFSWKINAGAGLSLTHGLGMVVSHGAKLGNNVTLFHGVTLGRRDRISADGVRQTEYPTIEDEVWIGPHAIIVGGITIGRGSRIAGGSFVTEDIPPYSVVAGNPSTIVKTNCSPDVMNPAPLKNAYQQLVSD